jgi:hypothetical protein
MPSRGSCGEQTAPPPVPVDDEDVVLVDEVVLVELVDAVLDVAPPVPIPPVPAPPVPIPPVPIPPVLAPPVPIPPVPAVLDPPVFAPPVPIPLLVVTLVD